ncbi:N-acetylglucosamine-6-sulfatase-like [Mya arenaria]|uniref:N-acetylglucosamine-6-sulfatase-like n=1 Tax=Mya arenaria TaxID=6604 RepID=UPI0022E4938E|nr:N-acetylglucosamine-6-sulfatase-like [Mya arenaria]
MQHSEANLVSLLLVSVAMGVAQCADSPSQPNIVFVLTDDQDVTMGGETPMVKTKKLIGDQGIVFKNMFTVSPLCCPSRSSILSGRYVHNHGAVNNSVEGGCNGEGWRGDEEYMFPPRLQFRGYTTFFAGKYLNQYGMPDAGGVEHVPSGWDFWNGLVGNSKYYDYSLSVNGTEEKHQADYEKDYLTDLIRRRGIDFLEKRNKSAPFFMMLSTPACHGPDTPAPQYNTSFPEQMSPREGSYNVRGKDKHWLIRQTVVPMPNDTVASSDNIFRRRWRTLLSVDDMVEEVVQTLERQGALDNTYIFFSSDNGFHLGQFGLPVDKRQLYEFDIRVPLMVRGPGIKPNQTSDMLVANIDLAPTFMELALNYTIYLDGISLKAVLHPGSGPIPYRDTLLIEHYGEHTDTMKACPKFDNQDLSNCNNHCVCEDSLNNTFSCMLQRSPGKMLKVCQLQDDEDFVEIYDTFTDPYEFNNLAPSMEVSRLAALRKQLQQLVDCEGSACYTVTH